MAFDPVQPPDCALLIGIPLTAAHFLADLERPEQEFAAIFRAEYPGVSKAFVAQDYERLIGAPIREIAGEVARWGVRVEMQAQAAHLAPAFARSRAVAVMAHSPAPSPDLATAPYSERSAAHCIEMRDGPMTVGAVADAIPDSWNGIVDFISCRSLEYARTLKQRHPETTFILNKQAATPMFRMRRFHTTIALLRQQPQPYGDAVVAVLKLAAAA